MHILLVEDDKRVSEFTLKGLKEQGWFAASAESAEEAKIMIAEHEWDIILMDIMLPGMDGIDLTSMMRYKKNHTPVLALSALSEPEDKVRALDAGADDYLSKPFNFEELIARIRALTRRFKQTYNDQTNEITCGDLIMDTDKYKVKRGENHIELSPKEFALLRYLLENQNKVVTRTQILHAVWGIDFENYTNTVDVYISYLRSKVDEPYHIKLIKTIKGRGYMISENE